MNAQPDPLEDRPAITRLPPMHALEAFESAARLSTFAAAAEELSVTQSAISHRIRLLEEHLGARLFVRVHRQVVLTPQGEQFLRGVREAMAQVANAAARIHARPGVALRITAAPSIAAHFLIPRMHRLIERMPELELEVDTSERVNDLNTEHFDVAVRLGAGTWAGCECEALLEERIRAFASPGYAAGFAAPRTFQALERAALIHNRSFSWTQWLRTTRGPVAIAARGRGMRFHEHRAATDAAVHGLGVVLSNDLIVMDARRRGLLVPFLDRDASFNRHYFAVYRPQHERIATIKAFIAWLREVIADEMARAPV